MHCFIPYCCSSLYSKVEALIKGEEVRRTGLEPPKVAMIQTKDGLHLFTYYELAIFNMDEPTTKVVIHCDKDTTITLP